MTDDDKRSAKDGTCCFCGHEGGEFCGLAGDDPNKCPFTESKEHCSHYYDYDPGEIR